MTSITEGSLPTLATARLVGHDGPIQTIRFAGKGEKYCLSGGHDRTVRLWNPHRLDPAYASTSFVTDTLDHSSNLGSDPREQEVTYRFLRNVPRALPIQTYTEGLTHGVADICSVGSGGGNDDQQFLFAACDKSLVVLDLVTARMLRKLSNFHTARINAVSCSRDANVYASASYDRTVALWDGRAKNSYKPMQALNHAKDSVSCVDISHTSPTIRTASVDGVLRTYDIRSGLMTCDNVCGGSPIVSMDVIAGDRNRSDGSDDFILLSCLDGSVRLLNADDGSVKIKLSGNHIIKDAPISVRSMSNGRYSATGSEDGRVIVYESSTGRCVRKLSHRDRTQPTCAVAANPSGLIISNNYAENDAIVWGKEPLGRE